MVQSLIDGESPQERYERVFTVKRMANEHPSAVEILKDLGSSMSIAEYYKHELEKRHARFDKEKFWPYLSQEEQKLIEHYQHYMENVKVHQDKIMRTVSLQPNMQPAEADEETKSITPDGGGHAGCGHNHGMPGMARNQRLDSTATSASSQDPAASMSSKDAPNVTPTSGMYTQTQVPPQVVSYKEMCTTGEMDDNLALERMRKLVFEVKKSPKYGADIMRGFEKRNKELATGNDRKKPLFAEDARCLINISSLFYDNLYKEEIKGHSMKHAYFVLAFQNYVNGLTFKKDAAENVILKEASALKVIKTLFEGQTRKIGANNFLRHIYTSKFSKIRIPEYQEMIIREILRAINTQRQQRGGQPADL